MLNVLQQTSWTYRLCTAMGSHFRWGCEIPRDGSPPVPRGPKTESDRTDLENTGNIICISPNYHSGHALFDHFAEKSCGVFRLKGLDGSKLPGTCTSWSPHSWPTAAGVSLRCLGGFPRFATICHGGVLEPWDQYLGVSQ